MRFKTTRERAEALDTARGLVRSAEDAGRELTADETKTIDETIAAAAEFERLHTLETKAAELGLASSPGDGERFDLSLKGAGAFARQALITAGGVKAALDATAVAALPTTRENSVDALPAAARAFLSLFEVRKRSTRTWTWLQQTVREDAAAPVKPGDTKPTSRYGLTSHTGELRPIAHLSEPVDKYLLRDSAELEGFLAGEMARGVFDALEAAVLNGIEDEDSTTETPLPPLVAGLLNTSGVHQITAGTDAVTTIRDALAAIETAGYVPGGVAMSPNTWAAIEAHRNASGAFDADGPINATDRKVWSVPVFTSTRVADGTAIAVDRSAVIVSVDEHGVEVEWDSAGERFARNEYVCRAETRIDVEVRKPTGIAVAALNVGA